MIYHIKREYIWFDIIWHNSSMRNMFLFVVDFSLGYKPFMLAIQNQVPVLCTILKNREKRHTNAVTRTTPPSNQVKGHHQQETAAPASPVAPDTSINNSVQNNLDFANSKQTLVRKESPKLIDTRQCQENVSSSNKVSEQGNCVIS